MKLLSRLIALLSFATLLHADMLPGFRVETVARVPDFASSVAVDSHGVVYCTTTRGWIYRIDGDQATPIASLPTHDGGNGGLLGMALLDDDTAAVHYTTWNGQKDDSATVIADVVSTVDLASGAEHVLHTFVCDVDVPSRGASAEHHGGNPTVAPDGSIFVGIGEYNGRIAAQAEGWNGGRVWRVQRDGTATEWARGLRNPYDLACEPDGQHVVVADNGPDNGDEINIAGPSSNLGWPNTFGNEPPMIGGTAPVYVFPTTVAPTGLARLDGSNALLPRGYLVGSFVTSAVYYFQDLGASPVPPPHAVVSGLDEPVIDVTQAPQGALYLATSGFAGTSTIRRLVVPQRGDCDGNGHVDFRDVYPLMRELADGGDPHAMVTAQDGDYTGSWGCDANADGLISGADLQALGRLISNRRRSVGGR